VLHYLVSVGRAGRWVENMEIILFWLLFSVVAGIAAGARGRNGGAWFLLAIFISPLLGLMLILVLPNLRQEQRVRQMREQDARPFQSDGLFMGIPYRAGESGVVDAVIQGKVIRFASMSHFSSAASGTVYDGPDNEVIRASGTSRRMQIIGLAVLLFGIVFFLAAIVYHAKGQLP
jgi:hypothetical protein